MSGTVILLPNAGVYSVRVRAVSAVGDGEWSETNTVEVFATPQKPAPPQAKTSASGASLEITLPVISADVHYQVRWTEQSTLQRNSPPWETVTLNNGVNTYIITSRGGRPLSQTTYAVSARQRIGNTAGPWSEPASAGVYACLLYTSPSPRDS